MSVLFILVCCIGGAAFVAFAVGAIWASVDSTWPMAALIVTLVSVVGLIPIGIVMSVREDNACSKQGGHMVDDGAPYYVRSGNVMVPIQPQKCEVPR